MKIYLASSWRNKNYERTLSTLRAEGFEVYDFRASSGAMAWDDIDPDWQQWTGRQFIEALRTQRATRAFYNDYLALMDADAVVLLYPCGSSAHMEAGLAVGKGKDVYALVDDELERGPELMLRACTRLTDNLPHLVTLLKFDHPRKHPAGGPA